MFPPSKLLIAALCLIITVFLYDRGLSPIPAYDVVLLQSNTPKTTTPSSYSSGAAVSESNDDAAARNGTSRIIQATMMFGHNYKGLNEQTLQSHAEHAKRWGYDDHVLTREIVGAGQVEGEGQWSRYIFSKILYILKLMVMELEKPREERAEWIVWYDADTLILNPNIPWETFLPPTDNNNNNNKNDSLSDIKILATKDISGFNAGLFFCRVDEWVIDALTDAYALPRLHPKIDISGNIEQNAMKHIFSRSENKKRVVYQPILWYNWFSSVERPDAEARGDMAIHFSGINHDNEGQMKKSVMRTWFQKLQKEPKAWQIPMEETRYPTQVPIFWHLLAQAKYILETVEDRGDDTVVEDERVVQIARNELKWCVEEEAYDVDKLRSVIGEMMDALRVSEREAEKALRKKFYGGKGGDGEADVSSEVTDVVMDEGERMGRRFGRR